ncbi:MAG: class I SAM-dependent methyltransferase [Clostridia bacterium]|nr:class I SAM-dependent methyltransferase [Clostridia bacterium]
MSNAFNAWADEYKRYQNGQIGYFWPCETLVRMMKGSYIPDSNKDYNGKNVLDMGFGNGNNLMFLGTLGLNVHGAEVHKNICDIVGERLNSVGYQADLRVGTNREIPFDSDYFDYLVSWNVIHYESTEESIREAIKEYHRVLKPGGRFFISTTGPKHRILKGAQYLGHNRYLIGREGDFRKGEIYFYFGSEDNIRYYFGDLFSDVLVGRTNDFLMTESVDYFIITGVKKG